MIGKQKIQGGTAAGWLIIVSVVLFFIYLAIKLTPAYMEFANVTGSMSSLQEQKVGTKSNAEIKKLFQKRLIVNSVRDIKGQDAIIKATPQGKSIVMKYDKVIPLFGNVSALLQFEHEQPLQ